MLRKSKFFPPLLLATISFAAFEFGLYIFPKLYDVDYTNKNPVQFWNDVHAFLLIGGLFLTVSGLIWAILLLCRIRSSIALGIGLVVTAATAYYLLVAHGL